MQALTFIFAFVAVLALIGARRVAGSPIRRQPPRHQYQSRTDAAAGRDRCRRRRWPPAPGAGPARQCRASADDRRPDRYRRRTQYRARDARRASSCRNVARVARRAAAAGWRRCPTPPGPTAMRPRLRTCRAADARAAAAAGPSLLRRRSSPPGAGRAALAEPARRADRAGRTVAYRADAQRSLAGIAPSRSAIRRQSPCRGRPEPRVEPMPMPSRAASRGEPMMPRPPRPSDSRRRRPRLAPPSVPQRLRRRRRRRRPLRCPRADQNLAEMAQRLEAALRRPGGETAEPPGRCAAGCARTAACPRRPQRAAAGPAGRPAALAEERL